MLCVERLSHIINQAVEAKRWKPILVGRQGADLSHLFFIDDIVLFVEASVEQILVIRACLDVFCEALGQRVNLTKSKILFSKNMNETVMNDICRVGDIQRTLDFGTYLGFPTWQGRTSKASFVYLLDRVKARFAGWKAKFSLAGRITLAKSVLNSLPFYFMQTQVLDCCL